MKLEGDDLNDLLKYLGFVEAMNKNFFDLDEIPGGYREGMSRPQSLVEKYCDALYRLGVFEKSIKRNEGISSLTKFKKIYDFKKELKKIVEDNIESIRKTKKFRNKMQHEPHKIGIESHSIFTSSFIISYNYNETLYDLYKEELKKINLAVNQVIIQLLKNVWEKIDCELKKEIDASKAKEFLSTEKYEKYNNKLSNVMEQINE